MITGFLTSNLSSLSVFKAPIGLLRSRNEAGFSKSENKIFFSMSVCDVFSQVCVCVRERLTQLCAAVVTDDPGEHWILGKVIHTAVC